ncbi:hypothetical protein RQP46_011493 [Phenoliferia psychrophenolica]
MTAIHSFPNEVLDEILGHLVTSLPPSSKQDTSKKSPALQALATVSLVSRQWRAVALRRLVSKLVVRTGSRARAITKGLTIGSLGSLVKELTIDGQGGSSKGVPMASELAKKDWVTPEDVVALLSQTPRINVLQLHYVPFVRFRQRDIATISALPFLTTVKTLSISLDQLDHLEDLMTTALEELDLPRYNTNGIPAALFQWCPGLVKLGVGGIFGLNEALHLLRDIPATVTTLRLNYGSEYLLEALETTPKPLGLVTLECRPPYGKTLLEDVPKFLAFGIQAILLNKLRGTSSTKERKERPFLHLKFGDGKPPEFGHHHRFAHQLSLIPPHDLVLPEGLSTDVQREGIGRYLTNNFKEGSPVHEVVHERGKDESTFILVTQNWHRSSGDQKLHLSLYVYQEDRHCATWSDVDDVEPTPRGRSDDPPARSSRRAPSKARSLVDEGVEAIKRKEKELEERERRLKEMELEERERKLKEREAEILAKEKASFKAKERDLDRDEEQAFVRERRKEPRKRSESRVRDVHDSKAADLTYTSRRNPRPQPSAPPAEDEGFEVSSLKPTRSRIEDEPAPLGAVAALGGWVRGVTARLKGQTLPVEEDPAVEDDEELEEERRRRRAARKERRKRRETELAEAEDAVASAADAERRSKAKKPIEGTHGDLDEVDSEDRRPRSTRNTRSDSPADVETDAEERHAPSTSSRKDPSSRKKPRETSEEELEETEMDKIAKANTNVNSSTITPDEILAAKEELRRVSSRAKQRPPLPTSTSSGPRFEEERVDGRVLGESSRKFASLPPSPRAEHTDGEAISSRFNLRQAPTLRSLSSLANWGRKHLRGALVFWVPCLIFPVRFTSGQRAILIRRVISILLDLLLQLNFTT